MKYISKTWLTKTEYIAQFKDFYVMVFLNNKGEEVRWHIISDKDLFELGEIFKKEKEQKNDRERTHRENV